MSDQLQRESPAAVLPAGVRITSESYSALPSSRPSLP